MFLREPLKTQKENIDIFAVSSGAEFDALKNGAKLVQKMLICLEQTCLEQVFILPLGQSSSHKRMAA